MSDALIFRNLPGIPEFMGDRTVTEINLNADGSVYVERRGTKERTGLTMNPVDLLAAARRIAADRKRVALSVENPFVNAALADGSRVAIMAPPISQRGVRMTIRKFRPVAYTLAELQEFGMFPPEVLDILTPIILDPLRPANILVSGGTGTGKTTFLNALLKLLVPLQPCIGLIEDTPEIKIDEFGNTFHAVADGNYDMRQCIRESLRQTPERLIIGEVRGAEAFDMVDALNTGHDGSFTTIHASSALGALMRLTICCAKAQLSTQQSMSSLKWQIAEAIHYVVQLRRRHEPNGEGKRLVTEVLKVTGYNSQTDEFKSSTLYRA